MRASHRQTAYPTSIEEDSQALRLTQHPDHFLHRKGSAFVATLEGEARKGIITVVNTVNAIKYEFEIAA